MGPTLAQVTKYVECEVLNQSLLVHPHMVQLKEVRSRPAHTQTKPGQTRCATDAQASMHLQTDQPHR